MSQDSYRPVLIPANAVPRRKEDYRLEQLDDELLLFHPASEQVLYLNQPASLVWGLCDGEKIVSDIVGMLGSLYPEAADQIEGDVQAALLIFLEHGCIELG